jgi:hypothetical protein
MGHPTFERKRQPTGGTLLARISRQSLALLAMAFAPSSAPCKMAFPASLRLGSAQNARQSLSEPRWVVDCNTQPGLPLIRQIL